MFCISACSTAQVAEPSGPAAATAAELVGAKSWIPATVSIAAGDFIKGSDRAEREAAYLLDELAYQHQRTREQKWYEQEPPRQRATTGTYQISQAPITNAQYRDFVAQTGHRPPGVDRATWQGYQLVHPFSRTARHAWAGTRPPAGRQAHPVVLVSYADAVAYADWLSQQTGDRWRLPTLDEWERAARGDSGQRFPWGDVFDSTRLNSHDAGPFDTVPVASYPAGASPHGMLDAAGQVFEWIGTDPAHASAWVKGGSWDDSGCGVCRPAARHSRPKAIKHILIGFRLVREPQASR